MHLLRMTMDVCFMLKVALMKNQLFVMTINQCEYFFKLILLIFYSITSTIRREQPAIDDLEFEKLDELSNGKLRHFLLGSPSGYKWSETTETILTFENSWREWNRIPAKDTKMLPKFRRKPLLEAKGYKEEEQKEIPINSNQIKQIEIA